MKIFRNTRNFNFCLIFIFFIIILTFTTCSDSAGSAQMGTVTINLGSNATARSALPWPPTEHAEILRELIFNVEFSGAGSPVYINGKKDGEEIRATLPFGLWNVKVDAYYKDEHYASGTEPIDVKPGENRVLVIMEQIIDEFIDSLEMIWIPAGNFTMGSDNPSDYASPPHSVTLTGFFMGKYPVTQDQWEAVMGTNPSYFHGGTDREPASGEVQGRRPVEIVSWYDALVFCNRLSMQEGLSPAYRINGSTDPADWGSVPNLRENAWDAVEIVPGSTGYRLPTEAQWEYACRAGTTTAYNTGDTITDDTGWYLANSGGRTREVGLKPANDFSLHDMHGNVFEWCWDWWGSYTGENKTDPAGADAGSSRIIRGGAWNDAGIRSAFRLENYPWNRHNTIGFRLVLP